MEKFYGRGFPIPVIAVSPVIELMEEKCHRVERFCANDECVRAKLICFFNLPVDESLYFNPGRLGDHFCQDITVLVRTHADVMDTFMGEESFVSRQTRLKRACPGLVGADVKDQLHSN